MSGLDPENYELSVRGQYAEAVKALRDEQGLTQDAAADRAGVSLQSWQKYEWAQVRFKPALIARVCKALGVDQETLEHKRAELSGGELAGAAQGEREFTRGPLSATASFRLLVTGDVGGEEIDNLILQLQLHRKIVGSAKLSS